MKIVFDSKYLGSGCYKCCDCNSFFMTISLNDLICLIEIRVIITDARHDSSRAAQHTTVSALSQRSELEETGFEHALTS